MISEPVEGVLLDFAGTLFMPEDEVDGVLAGAAALGARLDRAEAERLAAEYDRAGRPGGPYPAHVPPALADAYARRDLSSDEHRAAYVGLLETVEAPVPGLAAALYERVRLPEGFVPYADTPRLLGELRARGLRTALVSNIGFDLRPVLAGHGLAVDAFALSCELGVTKPDARMFHAACAAIGVPPARALMVGDHVVDGGAADAGIETRSALIKDRTRAGYFPGSGPIWVKLVVAPGSGRLLGGQIVGTEGAATRIDVLALAVWNEMAVDELALLDLAYAPPYSGVYDPLLVAAHAAAKVA